MNTPENIAMVFIKREYFSDSAEGFQEYIVAQDKLEGLIKMNMRKSFEAGQQVTYFRENWISRWNFNKWFKTRYLKNNSKP